ncbi:MAG: DNA cytosine methyltransferase, partial [[Eubacterium] siraeum]|nr:DNA cytosine methyltransferase [[Eubacterium] siraeum]
KRIYLVADFDGECAGKILFESESLSEYSAERFRVWQRTAGSAEESFGATSTICLNYQGGNNQPLVVETLKTFDVRFTSKGTKNARQNCYETETARTIDTSGNSPDSNQGGVAVVSVQGSMIGRANRNSPKGSRINENVSFTLNTADRHAVAFSQDAYYKYSENEKCGSLRASGGTYGGGSETLVYNQNKNFSDNSISDKKYIVRRLTPTECARLQGFPDWWCDNLETDNPTNEDIALWREIFEEHRMAMGASSKPKTDKQIEKWLKSPHSDSAEYKMWGNGVALPCVVFVMSGIVWTTNAFENIHNSEKNLCSFYYNKKPLI